MTYPWDNITLPKQDVLDTMMKKTKGQLMIHDQGTAFLGSLLCSHKFIWDKDCPTAWCNGSTIAFNPKFYVWLTPTSRVTVLAHELWHTGYDHMSRLGKERDPNLWNQAADFVINGRLDSWGFDFSQLMQIGPCLDHQYDGMTTEQIYRMLEQQFPPMPCPSGSTGDPNPSQGPGTPGLSGDLRKPGSIEEEATIKQNVAKAIQVSKMAKEAGVIPGEIKELISDFFEPVLSWEVLLARFYTELSKDDYSWKRPSRRYETEYLPSPDGDNGLIHMTYYLDVSGSVTSEQIKLFFSEVKFIHETLRPQRTTMVTFDTKIHEVIEIEQDDDFESFEITGRGGTSLVCVHDHIKKHLPTAAVIFSDMHVKPMIDNPGPPILWAIMGNKKAKTFFGQEIHIPDL